MKPYILSAIRYRTLKEAVAAFNKYKRKYKKKFTLGTMIYKFEKAYRVKGNKAVLEDSKE